MQGNKENVIVDKSFLFAVELIKFCEYLDEKRKFVVSNQLLRSGTSIGANIREAQNAESRANFIHKLKISAKECDETVYWLLLCEASENYPDCSALLEDCKELGLILSKIIGSAKRGMRGGNKKYTTNLIIKMPR
jgi:four helix bundle protein